MRSLQQDSAYAKTFSISSRFAVVLRPQTYYLIIAHLQENRTVLPRPFPLEFINVDPKDTLLANLIK